MTTLEALHPLSVEALSELQNQYKMKIVFIDGHNIRVESESCRIEFSFSRSLEKLNSVSLWCGGSGPFSLLYITLLRNDFVTNPFRQDASVSFETNFVAHLQSVQSTLMQLCDDLLRGDPSILINRERYYEFEKFMKDALIKAINSPPDDQISVQFRSAKFSWIKDSWLEVLRRARMNR